MNEEKLTEIITDERGFLDLPVIALRGKVLFPKTALNFDVGRPFSVNAINKATDEKSLVFIAAQKNPIIDNPRKRDIATVGVVAKIKQITKMPNGNIKAGVEALYRAEVVRYTNTDGYFSALVSETPYINTENTAELEANFRLTKNAFYEYSLLDSRITKDVLATVSEINDANEFVDNAMSLLPCEVSKAINMLSISDTISRLIEAQKLFSRELEIAKIEKEISIKVRQNIDKSQKEYYLREQLRAIHDELGDDIDEEDALREKIKAKGLPEAIEKKALKEIDRLDKINPSSPDYSIILNYLDWLLELPFNEKTEDTETLAVAQEILDKDHFGLEKVKQRIVEYIAVLKLTKKMRGPILCFVGPPGVGKTSVATSIARALNRKFVRMSLGGVKDEAEIRGHRRTYVGAMPGRIIFGLKNAGSANPVFLLDEIDKLSSDIHGDPASALLEVLDPEQNTTFRDRYMEIPYDLSDVMFITTANSLDTIPAPLLDRMEIIELSGYTSEEKLQIAKRYLIPKQLKLNGVPERKVEFTDEAIREIIEEYTMEAGVRGLERQIGSVIRKVAVKYGANPKMRKQTLTAKSVCGYLGIKKRLKDVTPETDEVGATVGLAWTSIGGTTLTIEVSLMKGKGELLLTGKLGDVMKESARAAISYIKSHAKDYGVDEEIFEKTDIHVHVPEGATPKDGPSAGITMATAILSALTGKTVKHDIAMTGEITLRGKVLPIGGLKEKALAAYRQGIYTVIIPKANERDLEEIPDEIRKEIKFIAVDEINEVFRLAINF